MAEGRRRRRRRVPTVWRVPDDRWNRIAGLLPIEEFLPTGGRRWLPPRLVLDGVLYVLRTGCQWKAVPREFGSGSTIHRRFQRWVAAGCFEAIGQRLLHHYDLDVGLDWRWQSADASLHKAPLGGKKTGPNPTDRAKTGTKRHHLTDGAGMPVAVALTAAHRPDKETIGALLDARVVRAPGPIEQHLCLDKGYDYADAERAGRRRRYRPHIRRRGEERRACRYGARPRRWVVERATSWFNRCRKLLIRWEKKPQNYLALVHFAAAIVVWRALVG